MGYKRYEKYKGSSVEWIGEIPEHWEQKKIAWLYDLIGSGTTPQSDNEQYYDGEIPWVNTGELRDGYIIETSKNVTQLAISECSALKIFPQGTLLIALYGATIGKLGIINISATTNQACCALAEPKGIMQKYQFYCFIANRQHIIAMAYGGGQPNISQHLVKSLKMPLPHLEEQKSIVKYLDQKTYEIDNLIADKEKLIELLQEQRQAIIAETVTKGLNPDVKKKDSGIEWIGEIPEHWEVIKAKYIANITRGAILRPVDEPTYFDEEGEWTYLNISDATICDKYLYEGKLRLSELGSQKSARVYPDNLIITASATIGKLFINKIKVCVHDGFIVFGNLKVNIDFLYYYLKNQNLYANLGKTNTQKNIYVDEVKNLIITVPSPTEQKDIAEQLDKVSVDIDQLIIEIRQQVANLRDYRQSLISEVVTGKIDVRGYSA